MTETKKIIQRLLWIIFFDQTYLTITFPLLTLIFFDAESRLFPSETSYAARSVAFGFCAALPNLINLFFAPFLSTLSDSIGRKKILIIEIASAFVFTLSVGLGVYYGQLLLIFLGYVVRGAFSKTNPTALAIVGDSVKSSQKILYMGYLQFAISVGATLGPFIGGYLAKGPLFHEFNFAIPFFVAASLALINTFAAIKFMPETLSPDKRVAKQYFSVAAIKEVFFHPDVVKISLILLLIQFSWSSYYQFIPPILKIRYQFTPQTLGFFIGIIAFWLAVTTGIGVKILQKYLQLRQILLFSIYLVLFGLSLTVLSSAVLGEAGLPLVWLAALPIAAGDVIAYSCLTALLSNTVSQNKQGKVMGVVFIVAGTTWAGTGFLGGFLLSFHTLLPLLVAPLGVLGALYLMHAPIGKKLTMSYANTID